MPVTVKFLEDYKNSKKGERARMSAPDFVKLHRQKIVKRIPTTKNDLKIKLWSKEEIVKKNEKKPQTKKKGVNPKSLENLKKKPQAKKDIVTTKLK